MLDDLLWTSPSAKNSGRTTNYTESTKWHIKHVCLKWSGQNGHKSTEFEKQLLWLSQSKFIYGRCHMSYMKSKSAINESDRFDFRYETRKRTTTSAFRWNLRNVRANEQQTRTFETSSRTVKTIIVREVQHTGCYQYRKLELPQAATDQLRKIDLAKLKRSIECSLEKASASNIQTRLDSNRHYEL